MSLIPSYAHGRVEFDFTTGQWLFYCEKPDAQGNPCMSRGMQLTPNNVASHERLHRPVSAYMRRQEPFAGGPIACHHCSWPMRNKNSMVTHHRRKHRHRGAQDEIFEQYGVLDTPAES
ncbi:hypothetical protein F4779DRAFT_633680 [Xylariaceae sp. FL0662B]|nr:hypothetical protein F4779DRAFT_633680 [Xylariaceae sp. FL0662B]